ncbi:class II fructose-bisphosphate aldolase [Amycolatopsis acidiphila]|uniref:Class II fructose-bisphosphate aldolase n=1 Tax=Amycolatopsis acidiphila TaxID=715473 RepID=A0A558AIJ5_9PSEU|nr:class II fructose-bisphosphate aldolase [Amycolatopsis acidiphila]TVT24093.1 class II fructose-bisphosphate aldolase [Amycolatopsis acidiphila]UIJ57752.1 class II fructose-bisphosphate aldolase [Amycolatopsis acidiphila]GHG87478.1 fructose-bisphosphate aldolase [Amycolatopsis acidiphila]
MPLVTTREIIDSARRDGAGVGAFNVITLEHAEAIVMAAESAGRPVILQISENAVKFHFGLLRPITMGVTEIATRARVPVSLHLDHVEDQELLHQAADAGFSSVMYDASKKAYADNVADTRDAARWARDHGLWLEAELGEIGGKNGAHAPGARTDPDEAAAYVAETGVDSLAVAIGSSHAMAVQTADLDLDLLVRLRDRVPVPLVLHGSSGVPHDQLRSAVHHGMVKINIGTALNVAYTGTVREILSQPDAPIDPRKYLGPARDAMAETITHLLGVLDPRQ